MKYSEQVFGNSEAALRLPNLVLLLVYMVYGYLLIKDRNLIFTIMIFLMLCTNLILMDLFGLARGYGMSCGFMLMSLYHYIKLLKENGKTDLILFHFAALLASLSNFTLVTFYVALLLAYNPIKYIYCRQVTKEKYDFLKANSIHFFPLLLSAIILYEPLRRVITYADLDFGGKNGFYQDTVGQLILITFHSAASSSSVLIILKVIFTLIVLISVFIIVRSALERRSQFFTLNLGLVSITFLTLIISLVIVLQQLILGSDYPIGRFAIFLFPLMVIQFGFLIRYFVAMGYRVAGLTLISCTALISTMSFIRNSNLPSYGEWAYDAETKNMIEDLTSAHGMNSEASKTIKLGINWIFEPTANFYRETKGLKWLLPFDRTGIRKTDDYFYIFRDELSELKGIEYVVIKEYTIANTLLVKNTNGQ